MASPSILSIGSILGTVAGGIVGGLGAEQQGAAQAAMYQYKAGIALLNRQINLTNANWALESGEVKAEEEGLAAGQRIAETKVIQAASGFDVNTGTGAAVRKTQETVSDFDQGIIRYDAAKTGWGFEAKAATDQAESSLDLMAASQAKAAGQISMISSFINAGTSVASKWYQGTAQGVFSSGGTGDPTKVGSLY